MADKVIVDIEIKGEAWERFNALFDKYNSKLKATNKDWSDTKDRVGDAAEAAGVLDKAMSRASDAASKFSSSIDKATKNFLKWGTGLVILKGLMGSGGRLFGLDKLAADATATRRVAQGLGMDYGSMQSFKFNFQRLVDAQALMSNTSTSRYDATSGARIGMMSLGLTGAAIKGMDQGDINAEVIKRIPEVLKNVSPDLLIPTARAKHLLDLVSEEDIIRIMHTPKEEIEYADRERKARKEDLTLNEKQQTAWSRLTVQLQLAGQVIETVFQKSLAPLAPVIEHISRAMEVAAKWLGDKLANGLKWLADKIGTMDDNAIRETLDKWAENVGTFLTSMMKIFAFIKKIVDFLGGGTDQSLSGGNSSGSLGSPGGGGGGGSFVNSWVSSGSPGGGGGSFVNSWVSSGPRGSVGKGDLTPEQGAALLRSEGATPEEATFIGAHMGGESQGNPYAHNTNAATGDNSYGLWQINMLGAMGDERRKMWGLKSNDDLFDPHVNARAALALYRAWRKKGGVNPWAGSDRLLTDQYTASVKKAAEAWKPTDGGSSGEGDTSGLTTHKVKTEKIAPQASDLSNFQGSTRQMAINLYSKPGSNTVIATSQVGASQHA
jgi:hypothetical protein